MQDGLQPIGMNDAERGLDAQKLRLSTRPHDRGHQHLRRIPVVWRSETVALD